MQIKVKNLAGMFAVIIAFLLGSSGYALSGSIQNVTVSGLAHNKLSLNQTVTISWLPTQIPSPPSIELYKNGRPISTIARNLNMNTASYRWRVMSTELANAEPTGTYKILVASDDNVFAFSEEFKLISLPKTGTSLKPLGSKIPSGINQIPPGMIIQYPTEATIVNIFMPSEYSMSPQTGGVTLGKKKPKMTIRWLKTGQQDSFVRIVLNGKDRSYGALLRSRAANDGSEEVEIAEDLRPGRYNIVITTLDTKIRAESSIFRIKNDPPSPPSIPGLGGS